jgi:hypothetical protein
MRIARLTAGLILTLLCISLQAQTSDQKLTVTGNLRRAVAIGGETTGWVIQLESEITVDGKQVNSIELDYHKTSKLEKLENQRVQVVGTLSHRQGVEAGERTVLVASSIREAKATGQPKSAQTVPFNLIGSEWLLEDLAGSVMMDGIQATLTFPEAGKIAGNGSCNRFFGPGEISGNTIKLGPLCLNPDGLPSGRDEPGDEISGRAPGSRALRVERSLFIDLLQRLRKAAALHAPITKARPAS